MSKNIDKTSFYQLPSGNAVHPCRLIVRDGTLMWKHALLFNNDFTQLPLEQAHEAHIVKTAQRLEELNAWVSQGLEPWEGLQPILWYNPDLPGYHEGIRVTFSHNFITPEKMYQIISEHIMPHEQIYRDRNYLTFVRC